MLILLSCSLQKEEAHSLKKTGCPLQALKTAAGRVGGFSRGLTVQAGTWYVYGILGYLYAKTT
jgi:uncharacterized membrane-anchored protein